jgi:IS30 family transposase
MYEMKKKIDLYSLRYELSPVDMSDLINRTPYKMIGFMTPEEKFKSMGLGGE